MTYWTQTFPQILPHVADGDIKIAPTALAVFLDETGDETMRDPVTPLFGRGGVAVVGADYGAEIEVPWRDLKRDHLGGVDRPFHATTFQRERPSPAQISAINRFFDGRFHRIAAMAGVDTSLPSTISAQTTVAMILKNMVQGVAAHYRLTRIDVIFESSKRANASVERDFSDWGIIMDRYGEPLPVTCFFADKKAMIAGLEVADLVMHTCVREERRRRTRPSTQAAPDFQQLYHRVTDRRLVSYMSIEKAEENLSPVQDTALSQTSPRRR